MPSVSETLRCPHCGHLDWRRARHLKATLDFVECAARETTSREVAERFRISIQNATNRMRTLEAMGIVRRAEAQPLPHGGREYVWRFIPEASRA